MAQRVRSLPLRHSPTWPGCPELSDWTSLWERGTPTREAPASSRCGRQNGISQGKQNLLSPYLHPISVPEAPNFLPMVLNLFSMGTRSEGKMGETGSKTGTLWPQTSSWLEGRKTVFTSTKVEWSLSRSWAGLGLPLLLRPALEERGCSHLHPLAL